MPVQVAPRSPPSRSPPSRSQSASRRYCASCGEPVVLKSRFCAGCGEPTEHGQETASPDIALMSPRARAQQASAGKELPVYVSSPRFKYGLAKQISWSGLPLGGGAAESSSRSAVDSVDGVGMQLTRAGVGGSKISRWRAATAALVAMNAMRMKPGAVTPDGKAHNTNARTSPSAAASRSALPKEIASAVANWLQDLTTAIAPLEAAFEANASAMDDASKAHDETFSELDAVFRAADPARPVARALVVRATRSCARMRAAVEKLDLECTTYRTRAERLLEYAHGVMQTMEDERSATSATLSVELSRSEAAYTLELQARLQAEADARAAHEANLEALRAEADSLGERRAGELEKARSLHEADKSRILGDAKAECERLSRELINARRKHADELREAEDRHAAAMGEMRKAHTAEVEEVTKLLRSTRAQLVAEEDKCTKIRQRFAAAEAEHAARHAAQCLEVAESEAQLRARIDALTEARDELHSQLAVVVDRANAETAELHGRVQHMRTVHSAALASQGMSGGGRQMLFYESMKSSSRTNSSMSWRGQDEVPNHNIHQTTTMRLDAAAAAAGAAGGGGGWGGRGGVACAWETSPRQGSPSLTARPASSGGARQKGQKGSGSKAKLHPFLAAGGRPAATM